MGADPERYLGSGPLLMGANMPRFSRPRCKQLDHIQAQSILSFFNTGFSGYHVENAYPFLTYPTHEIFPSPTSPHQSLATGSQSPIRQ